MLTELVKALEDRKTALEQELAAVRAAANEAGIPSPENAEKKRRLAAITAESIRTYKTIWQSFTPPNPFPCPFCYVFDGKISPLKPLHRVEDVEPVRCTVCGETFEIPVELLYA